MRTSEVIEQLEDMIARYGDLPFALWTIDGGYSGVVSIRHANVWREGHNWGDDKDPRAQVEYIAAVDDSDDDDFHYCSNRGPL